MNKCVLRFKSWAKRVHVNQRAKNEAVGLLHNTLFLPLRAPLVYLASYVAGRSRHQVAMGCWQFLGVWSRPGYESIWYSPLLPKSQLYPLPSSGQSVPTWFSSRHTDTHSFLCNKRCYHTPLIPSSIKGIINTGKKQEWRIEKLAHGKAAWQIWQKEDNQGVVGSEYTWCQNVKTSCLREHCI